MRYPTSIHQRHIYTTHAGEEMQLVSQETLQVWEFQRLVHFARIRLSPPLLRQTQTSVTDKRPNDQLDV